MEELQRKVVEGNGTLLFDMVCLMGFMYVIPLTEDYGGSPI
jgi:hypothetical protein